MLLATSYALVGLAATAAAHVAHGSLTSTVSSKLNINSTLKLNSGHCIPQLGFGVWQTYACTSTCNPNSSCGVPLCPSADQRSTPSPYDRASDVVQTALKAGYRHVDSAIAYGNEAPSASGLLASHLPRSSLFFTSKIPPSRFGYASTKAAISETLSKIGGLGYIDLYLMHAPGNNRDLRLATWKALVEAVEAGEIRSIGVSTSEVEHREELEAWQRETEEKEGKGKGGVLSVNQIQLHPWSRFREVEEWCRERGVVLEAYSPLAHGRRLMDPVLEPIARRAGKSPAQVLVRWGLQKVSGLRGSGASERAGDADKA